MATYRILFPKSDRVAQPSDYEAEDDCEALALFALRGERNDCELWCGGRLVAMIPRGSSPILGQAVARIRPLGADGGSARAVSVSCRPS